MKETDLQLRVVKTVRAHGGMAHKMAHKFLGGVPDTLVKLRECPAGVIEVKLNKLARSTIVGGSHSFVLDVTAQQWAYLNQYHKAGMVTGVFSFLTDGRELWMQTFRTGQGWTHGDHVRTGQYVFAGRTEWDDQIYQRLQEFFK